MIVILKRDIKGTGKSGEIVKVSDGYARNMLLPKGWAIEATKGNVNTLEKVKAKQEEEAAAKKRAAEELAEKIKTVEVVIKTKAGGEGRLFGSITSKDVCEALKAQHKIVVDKKKLRLEQPIKNLGTFSVKIKLYECIAKTREQTRRLNAFLCNRAKASNDIAFLSSPLTGGGIGVSQFGQLFLEGIKHDRIMEELQACRII